MAASKSLPLFHGDITLDTALEGDENMLQKIAYPEKRIDFYLFLYNNRSDIEAVVSRHLGLSKTDTCEIGGFEDWMAGSFNVCIPMKLNSPRFPRRVLIRFPLPYKVGESSFAGNADEKVRCEAATYLSIQDNCPTVPIPVLWGFGFSGGQSVGVPIIPFKHCEKLTVPIDIVHQARTGPLSFSTSSGLATDIAIVLPISHSVSICSPYLP